MWYVNKKTLPTYNHKSKCRYSVFPLNKLCEYNRFTKGMAMADMRGKEAVGCTS